MAVPTAHFSRLCHRLWFVLLTHFHGQKTKVFDFANVGSVFADAKPSAWVGMGIAAARPTGLGFTLSHRRRRIHGQDRSVRFAIV